MEEVPSNTGHAKYCTRKLKIKKDVRKFKKDGWYFSNRGNDSLDLTGNTVPL